MPTYTIPLLGKPHPGPMELTPLPRPHLYNAHAPHMALAPHPYSPCGLGLGLGQTPYPCLAHPQGPMHHTHPALMGGVWAMAGVASLA